jgi:hypothetical protein
LSEYLLQYRSLRGASEDEAKMSKDAAMECYVWLGHLFNLSTAHWTVMLVSWLVLTLSFFIVMTIAYFSTDSAQAAYVIFLVSVLHEQATCVICLGVSGRPHHLIPWLGSNSSPCSCS